ARMAVHGTGAARDSVSFGFTLAEAVGMPPETTDAVSTITPAAFRQRVNDLYGAMRDALQRGDWPAFGKAYDDLGRLLKLPTAKSLPSVLSPRRAREHPRISGEGDPARVGRADPAR